MKLPEHLTLSFLIAQLGARQEFGPAGTALVVAAGVLPDLDTITLLGGWRAHRTYHRVLGHGLPVLVGGPLALAWLGDLRARLAALPLVDEADAAPRSGPLHARQAHLAFFLHDEVIVHTPAAHAAQAAEAVSLAAEAATRLLFGDIPLDFRLDLQVRVDAAKE